jgi:hypothetical protein
MFNANDELEYYYSMDEAERMHEEHRMRLRHKPRSLVLYFRKGRNPKTGAEQWEARVTEHGKKIIYVVDELSLKPNSEQEVWLCYEGRTVFEKNDSSMKVVEVETRRKLFDGEVRLVFSEDKTKLVDGKHPWNAHHDPFAFQIELVVCIADKFGEHQPSADQRFWIAKFRKLVYVSNRGFILVVVDLVREDTEAKEIYLRSRQEVERQRQLADLAEQQRVSAAKKLADEQAERERKLREFYEQNPGEAERERRRKMNEREMGIINRWER